MKAPGPCILVVDDSEDHRYITTTELRRVRTREPFRIAEAARGDEALDAIPGLLRESSHLLVLSDYRMPNMGGVELLRAARARFPTDRLRFVIYSSTDHGVGDESRASGADVFLVKPMDLQDFRKELQKIVEQWLAQAVPSEPAAARRRT